MQLIHATQCYHTLQHSDILWDPSPKPRNSEHVISTALLLRHLLPNC